MVAVRAHGDWIISSIGGTSGSATYASQMLAHAQARLAADQAANCAPCTLKEDQKAVETAQGLVTAETSSAQNRGVPSGSADSGATGAVGRLLDIQV